MNQPGAGGQAGARIRFGNFTVEPSLQRLLCGERIVPLKPKAFDLLCLLLDSRDRMVGKDELMQWLWPRQDVDEANLFQTIYELRRALGQEGSKREWIENRPRRGYHFAGPVEVVSDWPATTIARSIAVLPFIELTDASREACHGLGIADAVITALSGHGGPMVRPVSAVMRFADSELDVVEIGRLLRVDCVLEGSIQSTDGSLRVSARLHHVASEACLWADTLTVPDGDTLTVQQKVAERLFNEVATRMTTMVHPPRRRLHTDNPAVHGLYMKGLYCWHQWTPDAWDRAIEYFDQALSLQPDHVPSHAWLGATWCTLGIFGLVPPRQAFARARAAAGLAVKLDDSYSGGYETLGAVQLFFDWQPGQAAASLDRAIELNPDTCNGRHLRALALAQAGHNDAAMAEISRALHADPQSLIAQTDVGYIHYWGRRPEQARECLSETLRLQPRFAHARLALGQVLIELGHVAEARAEFAQAVTLSGRNPQLCGELAFALGRNGDRSGVESMIAAMEAASGSGYFDPYQLALAWLGLGEHDQVFDWLERALENRSRDLVLLPINPMADPIRNDPRYHRLLDQAGLIA